MARALALAIGLSARRPFAWLVIALGFIALYYGILLSSMLVRFESLPNYGVAYPYVANVRLIFVGTPALSDALALLVEEPIAEIGFLSPQWNMAEWYLAIIPMKVLVAFVLGALIGSFVLVATAPESRACRTRSRAPGVIATAGGASMVGLTSATLSWVVCCASPTWVVSLAMMGMSTGLALALEPLGNGLTLGGFGLLLFALVHAARPLAETGAHRHRAGAYS